MLATVVILDKPKELVGLDQKVGGRFGGFQRRSTRAIFPPADRVDLRYPWSNTRNVLASFLRPLGRLTVRHTVGGMGGDDGRSECYSVMG